jgi:hypothetical protein
MRLMVVTPVDGGDLISARVTVGYMEASRLLRQVMPHDVMSPTFFFTCDIVRARNRAAAAILREHPSVSHVLWWDDDTVPNDMAIVANMLETGEDMIAGPYTNKRTPLRWIHKPDPDAPTATHPHVVYVGAVGFGFTITSRACLEKMSAHARLLVDTLNDGRVFDTPDLFGLVTRDVPGGREMLSEDFSFCHRWRQLGGRVAMYNGPGNIIGHVGTKTYSALEMPGAHVRDNPAT